MYGMLIEKPFETLRKNSQNLTELRTNPLIKSYEQVDEHNIVYEYYNDVDFRYNYTAITSLMLARQQINILNYCLFCKEHNIPVFYMAADCLASEVHWFEEAGFIGTKLGQLKIEAQNDFAIFVKKGLYYCGDNKIVTSLPKSLDIKQYVQQKYNITVAEMFRKIVEDDEEFTINIEGVNHVLRRFSKDGRK